MNYTYACGAVKGVEPSLLDKNKLAKLFKLDDKEFITNLVDMGYGGNGDNLESVINIELDKLKKFYDTIIPNNPVMNLFYLQNDAQNIKVILKSEKYNLPTNNNFVNTGVIKADVLQDAINKKNFDHIGEAYVPLVKNIFKRIEGINNPRVLSATIDACVFEFIFNELNTKYQEDALKTYFEIYIDYANILSCVRAKALNWNLEKFLEMFIPGGHISKDSFVSIYSQSGENFASSFLKKDNGEKLYKGLKRYEEDHNLAALERYLDELKLSIMKKYSLDFSTIGPLVYYYLEKQAEAKNIRLIYSDHDADTSNLISF